MNIGCDVLAHDTHCQLQDKDKYKDKEKDRDKDKFLKDPTCAIFLKSLGFKDIKYDTHQRIISALTVYHQCIVSASSDQTRTEKTSISRT